jgi:hypothetical protein
LRGLIQWLRRLSLIGVVVLPSFMATCSSGMSSLRINTLNMPASDLPSPHAPEVLTA